MTNKNFPVDVSLPGILLKPEELILPLYFSDWSKCVLEIGFGNGEYMASQAADSPDTLFFGIEVSRSCVMRAIKRVLKLSNIRIVSGDARFLMREIFPDESLDRVQMNFPCPWPKERHMKRRVASSEFADSLAAALKIDGYFELMTDDEVYARSTRDILNSHSSLEIMSYEHNPDRPIKTKYERKWLEMGRDIWRVRIRKNSAFSVARTIEKLTPEDRNYTDGGNEMHIRFGDLNHKNINIGILDSLFDQGGKHGSEVHWIFKRHFSSNSGDIRLIETVSSDAGFEQKYYLKVVLRDEEDSNIVLVKIDGNSSVYLTPSVRFALADLADRLKS